MSKFKVGDIVLGVYYDAPKQGLQEIIEANIYGPNLHLGHVWYKIKSVITGEVHYAAERNLTLKRLSLCPKLVSPERLFL
jgi:hypothetical protein